jgi:WS/DGAT/MGAT family acyltransferase
MYVIEGLDSFLDLPVGSFAVLLKVHHAAMDVAHSNEITTLLHDVSPHASVPAPAAPWFPEAAAGNLYLLGRAWFNLATFPLRMAQPVRQGWAALKAAATTFAGEFMGRPAPFPMTRFNSVVSTQRVFDTRRFALEDFKAIRSLVPAATVNDAVLAVCAGALRRYLSLQDELPVASMVAATPIAIHSGDNAQDAGFSWVRVPLGTDIAEPLKRLKAIQQASSSAEAMHHAISARKLTQLAQSAPSIGITATSRMLRSAATLLGDWTPLANCAITNVPGSQEPLYLQGAKLSYLSAIMPISDGMGLVFSVTSYCGTVVISFTACYEQVPDPDVLAQCLRDSFQEYVALVLAGRHRRPRVRERKAHAAAGEGKRGRSRGAVLALH